MVDLGTDISTFPRLDGTFTPISGGRVVVEAIARRLSTPRGMLSFHPDYGLDLRAWLNASVRDSDIEALRSAIVDECLKDERVFATSRVDVAFDRQTGTARVTIGLVISSGPFTLVLGVSSLSVDILAAGE